MTFGDFKSFVKGVAILNIYWDAKHFKFQILNKPFFLAEIAAYGFQAKQLYV